MPYTELRLTKEHGVAVIQLNNAKTLNALNLAMTAQLRDAFRECDGDDAVRVIILCGAGRAFCGGGDIGYFLEATQAQDFQIGPQVKDLAELGMWMKKSGKIVIAAVHGAAAGGGANLALAADIVIAADDAKFIQAFVNIGLAPDTGGAFWLPRIIGTSRAFEMFLTGRPVTAQEALAMGLVSDVYAPEALMDKAMALATGLAAGPHVAHANIKKMMYASMYRDFEDFIPFEAATQNEAAATEDFREGLRAFKEKRKPVYKGS